MTRNRDIARILGRTEANNTANVRLFQSNEEVGLDSAQVTTIATNAGTAVYTTLDSLPSSGLTSGDQAWVESSGRLYISNGSGWYNIALVNASPTLTLDQSGTIQLNADTLTVTVTATATDADDNQDIITFSVESDGNMVGTGTTLSQDSSVFTITAQSEDSGGTAGNFTLTFKATDQIAVDNESLSFSLKFSNIIDSSAETVFLLKADGNSSNNSAITFADSDGTSSDWTETGTPQATTFSPYRSGGYSVYFDGTGDRLDVTSSSSMNLTDSDFCIEMWVYSDDWSASAANNGLLGKRNNTGSEFKFLTMHVNTSSQLVVSATSSGSSWDIMSTVANTTTTLNDGEWNHIALVRNGTDFSSYINGTGTSMATSSSSVQFPTDDLNIGALGKTGSYVYDFKGYIRDFRIVKGSAVYTSDFTPPTESLTAISGTSVLACHLPYIADGSTNDHSVTQIGNVSTKPFGPYDYEPWVANDHGGSVYFDGNNDYLDTSVVDNFGTGDFTWESWIYPTVLNAVDNVWIETRSVGTDNGLVLFVDDGKLRTYGGNGYRNGATGTTVKVGMWHHVALVRSSGTMKIYLNGKEDTSVAYSGSVDTPGGVRIGARQDADEDWNGYVADIRLTTDAVYTSAFTPPTAPVSANSATKLLMQNKSDANIYDASAANQFRIVGAVTSSTTQRKFSTSSAIYHSGGQSKGIEVPTGTSYGGVNDLVIGANDFTVEMWARFDTVAGGTQCIATMAGGSGFTNGNDYQSFWMGISNANSYFLTQNGASSWATAQQGSSDVSADTWHHFAISRSGGTVRCFLDGSLVGSSYSNSFSLTSSNNIMSLMGRNRNTQYFDGGYIQDFRLTIGHARYTGTFTPPAAEFEL